MLGGLRLNRQKQVFQDLSKGRSSRDLFQDASFTLDQGHDGACSPAMERVPRGDAFRSDVMSVYSMRVTEAVMLSVMTSDGQDVESVT